MKVLFHHSIPVQFRRQLPGHFVRTAREMQWDRLRNGDLNRAADAAEFDVLLTADKKIFKGQSQLSRKIALVVLTRSDRSGLEEGAALIRAAVERAEPRRYELVSLPMRHPRER